MGGDPIEDPLDWFRDEFEAWKATLPRDPPASRRPTVNAKVPLNVYLYGRPEKRREASGR